MTSLHSLPSCGLEICRHVIGNFMELLHITNHTILRQRCDWKFHGAAACYRPHSSASVDNELTIDASRPGFRGCCWGGGRCSSIPGVGTLSQCCWC